MVSAMLNEIKYNTSLGISAIFSNSDFSKFSSLISQASEELKSRANKAGQFLNWVDLPKHQLARLDEIYSMVSKFKSQTSAKYLTVLGIGGSKHTVENMLSLNGLNIGGHSVIFYSDVDSASFNRYLYLIGNDVTSSNYMVASKSGSTFETKDGFLRLKKMLENAYLEKGLSQEEAIKKAASHFIAVTDKNSEKSELRRMSDSEGWIGNLYIHDDVGGRFSALDDHALFTLAYAGMSKSDMEAMLKSAQSVSDLSLSNDFSSNLAYAEAAFWASARISGIYSSVHQYLGSMFDYTVNWHSQMQNESVKDTSKQIAKVPDAMHHSSEAHFNPENTFAFALTVPSDIGESKENAEGYIGALSKSYSNAGAFFCEYLDTREMSLTPESAGAMVQLRAFATVYQEIIMSLYNSVSLPEVLSSVLQPHVEVYKKNLKPQADGKDVVVAGRVTK
ncbi:MAG: hypothetical protein MJ230_03325 [bacterium]|nr:hypothetical protein [bacterium]